MLIRTVSWRFFTYVTSLPPRGRHAQVFTMEESQWAFLPVMQGHVPVDLVSMDIAYPAAPISKISRVQRKKLRPFTSAITRLLNWKEKKKRTTLGFYELTRGLNHNPWTEPGLIWGCSKLGPSYNMGTKAAR